MFLGTYISVILTVTFQTNACFKSPSKSTVIQRNDSNEIFDVWFPYKLELTHNVENEINIVYLIFYSLSF